MSSKSANDLKEIYDGLILKCRELDSSAVRDKKYDFPVMSQADLENKLAGKISDSKKKELLLTQIGNLRINMFSEYYDRVNRAQEKNQLTQAVKFMDLYADTIAIPFIRMIKESNIEKWFKKRIGAKIIDRPEIIKEWKALRESWTKQDEISRTPVDEKKRKEKFSQLKLSFFTLYTYSFSPDTYPPLHYRRTDHD